MNQVSISSANESPSSARTSPLARRMWLVGAQPAAPRRPTTAGQMLLRPLITFRLGAKRLRVPRCACSRPWRGAGLCIGALVVLGITGCSSSPHNGAAVTAARSFVDALRNGNGGMACSLLTEQTRSSIAGALDVGCPQAVTHLVEHGDVIGGVQVWGDAAQVRIGSDVLFLRLISGQWQVSAAGCSKQPKGPYDCKVG